MKQELDRQPRFLSLATKGFPEWPRYAIHDQYGRYWSGSQWVEEQNAKLYADPNEACQQVQELLLKEYSSLPTQQFQVPLRIDVFSERKVSLHDVQAWLFKVVRLLVDSPRHGNGPLNGSLGLCQIDWDKLSEIET